MPIGAWSSALVLDAVAVASGQRDGTWDRAGDVVVAAGLAVAAPTLLTGMADLLSGS